MRTQHHHLTPLSTHHQLVTKPVASSRTPEHRRGRTILWPLLAAACIAGCATNAPEQHLLALTTPALPNAASVPAQSSSARWLQVGRLEIPEYWQSHAVRYREGNEVKTWDNTVWAERVEVGLTRNLGIELEHALPAPWRLCPQRCDGRARRPVRLLISLSPMDYDRGTQTLSAWAQWTLIGAEGQALHTSNQALQSKGSGTQAAAQTDAMADMMKAVADLVARDVAQVPASATERLDAKNGQ